MKFENKDNILTSRDVALALAQITIDIKNFVNNNQIGSGENFTSLLGGSLGPFEGLNKKLYYSMFINVSSDEEYFKEALEEQRLALKLKGNDTPLNFSFTKKRENE